MWTKVQFARGLLHVLLGNSHCSTRSWEKGRQWGEETAQLTLAFC